MISLTRKPSHKVKQDYEYVCTNHRPKPGERLRIYGYRRSYAYLGVDGQTHVVRAGKAFPVPPAVPTEKGAIIGLAGVIFLPQRARRSPSATPPANSSNIPEPARLSGESVLAKILGIEKGR